MVRSPFLDHRIFEWVFAQADRIYFGGEKKRLLKRLLSDQVPAEIIHKPKQGFSVPVKRDWNDKRVDCILSESRAVTDGLFSAKYMKALIQKGETHSDYSKRWLLMIFELWYRKWISAQ